MAKKIGIYSVEKNCGKTTTAAFLAESFATLSSNVLMIDLDNYSTCKNFLKITSEVKESPQTVKIAQTSWKYLHLGQEIDGFKNELESYDREYDYIIFDFPSLESDSNTEILKILNGVIIPIECEFYGIDNLNIDIEKLLNIENLKIDGILLIKYDERNQIMPKFLKYIKDNFSDLVYDTIISRNYYLGLPQLTVENLNNYIPNLGFADYLKLANEIQNDK
jgi:chromosome partitioning protein